MARFKHTTITVPESIVKGNRKSDACTSSRLPPTASNRRILAVERENKVQEEKEKEVEVVETTQDKSDQNSSKSLSGGSSEADEHNDEQDECNDNEEGDEIEEEVNIEEEEPLASMHKSKRRRMEHVSHTNSYSEVQEGKASGDKEHISDEYVLEEEVHELQKRSIKNGKRPRKPSCEPTNNDEQPGILFAFKDHIARRIWNSNKARGEARIVRVHSHVGTHRLWDYRKESSFVQDVVAQSGFQQLVLHAHERLDKVLINAFVERFYPETNTFHLPFGELGITIDEVVHITGLPAEGRAVTGSLGGSRGISSEDVYQLLEECLGIDKPTAIIVLAGDKKIRLEWLRSNYEGSKNSDSEERKMHCATAYLLYTIGCLICSDKSGNKVSVHFLQCLKDLKDVGKYSWATACLSWLLRNLGIVTRSDVHQMTGCMTLLQVWIFDHFPSLRRHNRSIGVAEGDIRAACYFAKEKATNLASDLVMLREKIDDLKCSEIIWDCFKGKRDIYMFQQCSLYNGPLICFETEELYLPQRLLRQFGYVQPIPNNPFTLNKKKLKSSTRGFKASYNNIADFGWSEWRNHMLNETVTSKQVVHSWDCEDNYMLWYRKASHPLVANPKRRITEPVNEADEKSLLTRIKRRLGQVADIIRSCEPSEPIAQALQMIERIEEPEPSDLYREQFVVDQGNVDIGMVKGRAAGRRGKKGVATKKTGPSKKKHVGRKKKKGATKKK